MAKVVAPPYDIIPPELQRKLYKRDARNIVRLILGKIKPGDTAKDNRYTRARRYFEQWLGDGTMVRDGKDAIYIYSQRYRSGTVMVDRIGFIALMALKLGGKSGVLSHENTLLAPKIDRMDLMRSVKANLSPIFILYDDRTHRIVKLLRGFCRKTRPLVSIDSDGVKHMMWRMDDPRLIGRLEALMRPKELFIADGHHRCEVAHQYAREVMRTAVRPALKRHARFMMAYFVESDERMLSVFPAHRLIKDIGRLDREGILERLEKHFTIRKVPRLAVLMRHLAALAKGHVFGMYCGGSLYLLKLKDPRAVEALITGHSKTWKRLDVTILHRFIMQHLLALRDEDDNVAFVKDPAETRRAVDQRRFKLAFFLNPTKVAEVKAIAKQGERMPRKATYFYPKPLSGLVINALD